MKLKIYQIDAFTDTLFKGNPAAVIPLKEWLNGTDMQLIAAENNLSETAFFKKEGNFFHIRWFTPKSEVELCGHATLASAFVIFKIFKINSDIIRFQSLSGILKVKIIDNLITLDFPSKKLFRKNKIPNLIIEGLGIKSELCFYNEDFLMVFNNEDQILNIVPDFDKLKKLPLRGIIVTAQGNDYDFISRSFFPKLGVLEDPVTGSAHTMLIPYWSNKLGKKKMIAKQASERTGLLICENKGKRVLISGYCKLYMKGNIRI